MIKALVLLFLLLCPGIARSQRVYTLGDDENYTDSIKILIASTTSDSIRCYNSYKLANLFRRSGRAEESKVYFEKANRLSGKFPFLKDASVFYNAASFLISGDLKKFENQLYSANEKLKKYQNKTAYALRAYILSNLSILKQINNNEKEAMRILVTEAIPLAKQADDHEIVSSLYKSLGIILMNYPDREKASMYLELAIGYLETADKRSPTLQELTVEIYAINAENLVELGNLYAAKNSLDKAFAILKDYPSSNLNNLYYFPEGLYYYKLGQLKNALASYNKGIESAGHHGDLLSMNRLKYAKYMTLREQKNYPEARQVLLELIRSPSVFVLDKKNWYKELARTYETLGDVKNANHFNKLYIALSDSLHNASFQKEIGQLEVRFNKAENENKIRQLEAQKERMRLVAENSKLYYGIFALVCLILLTVLILFWIKSKSHKKLALEKEKNYQQNMATLEQQKEIEVMQAAISGEEIERKRIARDLHDGIGSLLSSMKMKLMKDPRTMHSLNGEESEQVSALLNRSITELRQIAYNLVPETLLTLGLEHALNDLCSLLKTDSVHIACHYQGIRTDISESNQIMIYRIIQELINNALKHSGCTEIIVDCHQNQDMFFITVEDNGCGFRIPKNAIHPGAGLKNLRNRVQALKGKIDMDSSPGEGTAFNIELSISYKHE